MPKDAHPEALMEPLRVTLDPSSQPVGVAVVLDRTGEVA
jgi:hypothetical protein